MVAVSDRASSTGTEMNILRGDLIHCTNKDNLGWLYGENCKTKTGKTGRSHREPLPPPHHPSYSLQPPPHHFTTPCLSLAWLSLLSVAPVCVCLATYGRPPSRHLSH